MTILPRPSGPHYTDPEDTCRDCGDFLDSIHHHIECVAPLDQLEEGA